MGCLGNDAVSFFDEPGSYDMIQRANSVMLIRAITGQNQQMLSRIFLFCGAVIYEAECVVVVVVFLLDPGDRSANPGWGTILSPAL